MPRLVFLTDLHLNEGTDSAARFARDLAEIRALDPPPDLLAFGGDICLWSDGALDLFRDLLGDCPIPQLHAMGNHDTTLDVPVDQAGRDFEAAFNPVSAHRRLGEAHVIALNTCAMDPAYIGSRDWHNVLGWVPDADLAWLEQTLSAIEDRDAPLIIFTHIPFFSTYPDRLDAGQAERDVWVVGNAQRVVDLLRPFGNCTVLQGHLHENEHLWVEGIHFVSVGAIGGAWWSGQGFAECVDGAARGYLVADIRGRDVALQYRAAGCSPEYRACSFAAEGRPYLNLFFADARAAVEVQHNNTWVSLQRDTELIMRGRWTSAHTWALPDEVAQAGGSGATRIAPLTVRTHLDGREDLLESVPFDELYMADPTDRRR